MFKITNTEEEDSFTLSTEGLDTVKSFLSTLEATNTVTRDEVVSLESFLGYRVITKNTPINKISNIRSSTSVDEICEELHEFIKVNNSVEITLEKTLSLYNNVKYSITELIAVIKNLSGKDDFLDRLINEKYTLTWDNDELVDISKREISTVFQYRYNMENVLASNTLEQLQNVFKNNNDIMLTGLMVLCNKSVLSGIKHIPKLHEPHDVTLYKIVEMVRSSYVEQGLLDLLNMIEENIASINSNYGLHNNTDLNHYYKYITSVKDVVLDKYSVKLLNILYSYD